MKHRTGKTLALVLLVGLMPGLTPTAFAMQIFVKTLTGKTITLEVEPGDSIQIGEDGWSGGYVAPQRAWRVSFAPMQDGSASFALNSGETGESMNVYAQTTVWVRPSPAPGYVLDKIVWSLIDGSASYDITQSQNFVMPAMDVVVYVTFAPAG